MRPQTFVPYVAATLNNLGMLNRDQNRMKEVWRVATTREVSGDWRGSREAIPKPLSRHWTVREFTRTLAGLMSLWIMPHLMQVAHRSRKANGQAQRKRYVQWLTE